MSEKKILRPVVSKPPSTAINTINQPEQNNQDHLQLANNPLANNFEATTIVLLGVIILLLLVVIGTICFCNRKTVSGLKYLCMSLVLCEVVVCEGPKNSSNNIFARDKLSLEPEKTTVFCPVFSPESGDRDGDRNQSKSLVFRPVSGPSPGLKTEFLD
jgi:hypothetical protein